MHIEVDMSIIMHFFIISTKAMSIHLLWWIWVFYIDKISVNNIIVGKCRFVDINEFTLSYILNHQYNENVIKTLNYDKILNKNSYSFHKKCF